jgi:NET1-associated nuclear protein 1 (U3 small nucleolar RNA-associated protein 17)
LSKQDPDFIWVACSDGNIYRLNWTLEKPELDNFQTASKTAKALVVVPAANAIGEAAIVAESDKTTRIELVAYDWKPSSPSKPSPKSLVSLKKPGSGLQLLESSANGQVLTGAINDRLFIAVAAADQFQYDFYSFDTPDLITSIDMRVYKRPGIAAKKGKNELENVVDIIVGGARGGIYLYHDAVARCQAAGMSNQNGETIHAQKYHWHRKAVHSVKWSKDGMHLTVVSRRK